EYRPASRKLPAGTAIVETEQSPGAVAVYLCEARSDDGALACGWIEEPKPGDEVPIVRVTEPLPIGEGRRSCLTSLVPATNTRLTGRSVCRDHRGPRDAEPAHACLEGGPLEP